MTRARSALPAMLSLVLLACSEPGTGPTPANGPLLSGTVHAVGGGPVDGLWAAWRENGTSVDSVAVASDGSFQLRASEGTVRGELLIDGSAPRAFHPLLFPFMVDSLDGVDLLLIPRAWTVRDGAYDGQTVSTSLDLAVEDDADQVFYTYFFGQPHPRNAPERFLLELMTWPLENLPALVALDHEASTDLTPDDSTAIWGVLDAMEEATGLDLFAPVPTDPTWWSDPDGPGGQPFEPGVIRVVHEPGRWGGLPQSDEAVRARDGNLGSWDGTGRFTAFRERHLRLNGGLLLVDEQRPLRLADGLVPWATVLTHEALHVLGLGHTCRIPSPMGPCARTPGVSEFDVAYMELLREALHMARTLDAVQGLTPSIVGERRVLLDLPPLPTLGSRQAGVRPPQVPYMKIR